MVNEHRTIIRKFKEMLAAERIEAALDKSQILQLYLNLIYLGRGAYGVAAAAQRHFGKKLSELTVEEAAYLAGLPKEPNLDAARNYQKALERRNWVIGQMAKGGYISSQEAEAAASRPLTVNALSH
jgi:penicillin-binding protein 1A